MSNMFKANNKDIFHQNIKTYFMLCSSVSIFNFEQVNMRWEDKNYFFTLRWRIWSLSLHHYIYCNDMFQKQQSRSAQSAFYNSAEKQWKKLWSSFSSTVAVCRLANLLKINSCAALSTEISPNFLVRKYSGNAPLPKIFTAFTEKFFTRKMMKFQYLM